MFSLLNFLIISVVVVAGSVSAGSTTRLAEIELKNVDSLKEGRSISSSLVDAIENVRDQMPCGFPALGLPPMAPLQLNSKDIDVNFTALNMQGSIENFRLDGLNNFNVTEMKVNIVSSKVKFTLLFHHINIETIYDLRMKLQAAGFTVDAVGAGPAKLAFKDMEITGVIKYSANIFSGKLRIKSAAIQTKISDIDSDIRGMFGQGSVNNKINSLLEEAIQMVVNTNNDLISNKINTFAIPLINQILDQYGLNDFMDGLGVNGDGNQEPCQQ